MAQIIGQVFNPDFLTEKEVDGKKKSAQFRFTLGHRKAFPKDGEKNSMIFTNCVGYGIANLLNDNFGQPEHHGKWVSLNGHWDEYDMTPDFDNEYHKKYLHKETLTRTQMEALGFKFAEGSREKITFQVAPKTTMRKFVVNSIEFVGSAPATAGNTNTTKNTGGIRPIEDEDESAEPASAGDPRNPWEK